MGRYTEAGGGLRGGVKSPGVNGGSLVKADVLPEFHVPFPIAASENREWTKQRLTASSPVVRLVFCMIIPASPGPQNIWALSAAARQPMTSTNWAAARSKAGSLLHL